MFIQEEDRKTRRKEDRHCFYLGFFCGLLFSGSVLLGQFFLRPFWG